MRSLGGPLSPARAAADAAFLFVQPEAVFARLREKKNGKPLVLTVLFWGLAAGLLDAALTLLNVYPGSDSPEAALITVALCPPFFLLCTGLLTLLYHPLILAAGGRGLGASFAVMAALSPLLFLEVHLGALPFLRLPILLFRFYLLFKAAESVHKTSRRRTWYVFGPVFAVLLLLSLKAWSSA